jgi:hypothetical protein
MDLLVYRHLFPEIGNIVLEYIASDLFVYIDGNHFLLRGNSLIKYNERRCYMSHHQCLNFDNQVKIICHDPCPTKDNIGWMDLCKECYNVDCLSKSKSRNSKLLIGNVGQNGMDSTVEQVTSEFMCQHGQKCTLSTNFTFKYKNIQNVCALSEEEIIFLGDNKLIKCKLKGPNLFESYNLCSCTLMKYFTRIVIDGSMVILFSTNSDVLCVHQFDLLKKTWVCTTIDSFRDVNSKDNPIVTIDKFMVLKGKYNPKTLKRKM